MPLTHPDLSPLPVELLTLGHSNLYTRRMKEHGEKSDDYEDIDEVTPTNINEVKPIILHKPVLPPKPFIPLKPALPPKNQSRSISVSSEMHAVKSDPGSVQDDTVR